MLRNLLPFAIFALAVCLAPPSRAEVPSLKVPPGFEVTRFAADDLATDIQAMTLDGQGRVVVSGPGYIKRLIDDDNDGRADRAQMISDKPKSGAMGLCFVGPHLLATGDNALLRFRNAEMDDREPIEPLVIMTGLKFGEHGPHAIRQGPDGWSYVICGNNTGITAKHATTPNSPVRVPESGTILRFSPDFKDSEIVAHGFRNAYDFDFNSCGNLFTYDSDGERDTYLPWYASTRIYDVAIGMHHGWREQPGGRSWCRPPEWFDCVQRLAEVGRGSPTGVTVYRHRQFPAEYRGGLFTCCWTLGRVYFFPLARDGASYQTKQQIFLHTTGQTGFAPTDICVAPDGSLLIAIGGRKTQGSVFRIRWTGAKQDKQAENDRLKPALRQVLDAEQPLEAWSRAKWMPLVKQLKAADFEEVLIAREPRQSTARQLRAIEILTEQYKQVRYEMAEELAAEKETDPEVLARLAWSLGRNSDIRNRIFIAAMTGHEDPRVARAAWEAWLVLGKGNDDFPPEWITLVKSESRRVRAACWLADRRADIGPRPEEGATPRELLAWCWRKSARGELTPAHGAICLLQWDSYSSNEMKLEAMRIAERSLGDMRVDAETSELYAGYDPRLPATDSFREALRPLAAQFPTGDLPLDRELGRIFGMTSLDDAAIPERWSRVFTAQSRQEDDLHFLICLSMIPGKRPPALTEATAKALTGLHPKMEAKSQYAGRNWSLRVSEVSDRLIVRDPALPAAILAEGSFRWPSQSLIALQFSKELQQAAARKLLRVQAKGSEEMRWTSDMVKLVSVLPVEEARPALRNQWEDATVRDPIIRYLAAAPQEADRERLAETLLSSADIEVLIVAAEGLAKLSSPLKPDERFATMVALRQHASQQEHTAIRRALIELLVHGTGQKLAGEDPNTAETDAKPWLEWYTKSHPAESKRLVEHTGADLSVWLKRIEAIDWEKGDAERGRVSFEKRACFRCHGGTTRFGPDLAGVAGRLSRADLLAAILDPSREVSPAYKSMQVVTGSGKIVTGMLVYESPEAMLVQTAPDTTIRIAGEEITSVRPVRLSPMPIGLLNGAKDEELSDLLAYLATLKGK